MILIHDVKTKNFSEQGRFVLFNKLKHMSIHNHLPHKVTKENHLYFFNLEFSIDFLMSKDLKNNKKYFIHIGMKSHPVGKEEFFEKLNKFKEDANNK